jgi:hypothetical protein
MGRADVLIRGLETLLSRSDLWGAGHHETTAQTKPASHFHCRVRLDSRA